MEDDIYKTIEENSEGIYKDKGSKFIAKAYSVKDENQIKEIITDLKKEYYDARHHCYAYRIGPKGELFRANDDGEPSSTAGKPILGQLLSKELTNILIVVIRYFGGTKLGVSGLINAYKSAALDAIQNTTIIEQTVNNVFEIAFDYIKLNDIMKIIKDEEPAIISQVFELNCLMSLSIRSSKFEKIKNRMEKVEGLQLKSIHIE